MSEKYIDLADRIKRGHGDDEVREGIDYALHWLDAHPDQVPGRTVTASQYSAATRYMNAGDQATFASGFALAGGSLVPDPEPTIPLPTEPGARFIAYSPKWSDGPQDQREFVVAGTSIVDIDTGNTCHRAAFADYWTVTALVKAPGGDDDQ